MKPLKLTMSAFGSYTDTQEIDFAELGTSGLYLITGETGSGKTLIFDAISFALYGKASGASRDDYSMLRSDFTEEAARTFVELEFVSGDNRYRISRRIKKNGQDVALVLPDGTTMGGDRNVRAKIAEIIGLDRGQFAQIVMIAQYDFLRFLQSGTDERLAILRSIFDTGALRQFQERLKALVRQEGEKRARIIHEFDRYGVDVYKRDGQFAEWKKQIQSDRSALAETDKKLVEYDRQKQALAAGLAVAEGLLKKFEELADCRNESDEHGEKAAETERLKMRVASGETALYKVKPLCDAAQKAAASHSSSAADLAKARSQEEDAIAESESAGKAAAALPPLDAAQEAFALLSKESDTAAQNLASLTGLQEGRNAIAGKQAALDRHKEELGNTLDSLSRLPDIDECQAGYDKASAGLKDNEERLQKLSAMQNDLQTIAERQLGLARAQAEFEERNKSFNDANKEHRALEEAFLRGQAGIIAQSLKDGEPCPVCGSAEHPAPAKLSGGNITDTKLKEAGEKKDKEQSRREAQASACGALQSEIETRCARFLEDLAPMVPDADIETASPLLEKSIGEANSAIAKLSREEKAAGQALSVLKADLGKLTQKRDGLSPVVTSLQSEIDTLTKRFLDDASIYIPGAGWESSEPRLAGLLAETQALAGELAARKGKDEKALHLLSSDWDAATKRRVNAESCVRSAKTLVAERAANEQKSLRLSEEAQSAFAAALQANGFRGEEGYKAVILTEAEIAGAKKRISDYEKKGDQLARDISRLESETAGKEQPDLGRLRLEAERASFEAQSLIDKRDGINERLNRTENMLQELRLAAKDFEKVEKTYAAVKQLADTANGKLDFETYAQMAYFERVLRAANLRLKKMSLNRYALLRKSGSDDGRRRSGLELEVMDAYTGKPRSANSLSGGESFMASLSLALGLSDVVQQTTGGVRLDAMFIDEGFGTLDADVLDLAIGTLSEMAGANRIVGIISHVAELRERIDKQVQVEKTTAGSKIKIVV